MHEIEQDTYVIFFFWHQHSRVIHGETSLNYADGEVMMCVCANDVHSEHLEHEDAVDTAMTVKLSNFFAKRSETERLAPNGSQPHTYLTAHMVMFVEQAASRESL